MTGSSVSFKSFTHCSAAVSYTHLDVYKRQAFFSSAETAFTTVNKIRIRTFEEEGRPKAALIRKIIEEDVYKRQDFISYKYTDYKNPSVRINCRLFQARLALWTINTLDAYDAVRNNADLIIFEGIEP